MKISECLNSIPETSMGYIRLIQFTNGGEGQERMMDSLTNRELVDIQQKDAPAYYRIGEYWYILANS